MHHKPVSEWVRFGLLNLMLVAVLGVLMRYNMVFALPWFDQRNLLHAHSHFAFSGWLSHLLYVFLPALLQTGSFSVQRKYRWLILANLITSYGMLIAFALQGYKGISIAFSTLNLLTGITYAWIFIRDSRGLRQPAVRCAIAGLISAIISALGPFSLAWQMATHQNNADLYTGSVYFYLHFQYNGWFFFGLMALIIHFFGIGHRLNRSFYFFVLTLIPTVILSLLWIELPNWLYGIVTAATLVQLAGCVLWMKVLWGLASEAQGDIPFWVKVALVVAASAIALKFFFQTLMLLPSVSELALGFRPIVIAYLHLVLLAGYSLFLVGFLYVKGFIAKSKITGWSVSLLIMGILFNELLLGLQAGIPLSGIYIPFTAEGLLLAAGTMLTGAAGLFLGQFR